MNTKIEWCDKVWNPITGCSPVSAGCDHCYASRMANRLRGRCGYPKDDPFRVTFHQEKLMQVLRLRKSQRIFVNSMSDLFHKDVPDEWLLVVFVTMGLTFPSKHTFMILTKRPERMKQFIDRLVSKNKDEDWERKIRHYSFVIASTYGFPIPENAFLGFYGWLENGMRNLWLGVTAENQQAADERIPILLQTPAAIQFVSCEPMLGPIDLRHIQTSDVEIDSLTGDHGVIRPLQGRSDNKLTWVICGGESGPKARPMHPDWARSLRNQCVAAGVPYFFKQWGEWVPGELDCGGSGNWQSKIMHPKYGNNPNWNPKFGGKSIHIFEGGRGEFSIRVGKKAAGTLLDGREWRQFPEVQG